MFSLCSLSPMPWSPLLPPLSFPLLFCCFSSLLLSPFSACHVICFLHLVLWSGDQSRTDREKTHPALGRMSFTPLLKKEGFANCMYRAILRCQIHNAGQPSRDPRLYYRLECCQDWINVINQKQKCSDVLGGVGLCRNCGVIDTVRAIEHVNVITFLWRNICFPCLCYWCRTTLLL